MADRAYFDTSVLLKRYVQERGSERTRSLVRQYRFVSSALAPVEAIAALSRRRAAGTLAEAAMRAIVKKLRSDRLHWELVEVSPLVLDRAERVVEETSLRTLDALHVASALTFRAATGIRAPFITADANQRDVVGALGLDVIWVG
jgi:predicted nucleic acid-binding protein